MKANYIIKTAYNEFEIQIGIALTFSSLNVYDTFYCI
jgi:hypothetical protein